MQQEAGGVEPRKEETRCTHYYHYFLHEQLGLCYVRIQSWFPFTVRVGLNGRRWLGQQLRNRGARFEQRGNLITQVEDVELAQRLLEEQKHVLWPDMPSRSGSARSSAVGLFTWLGGEHAVLLDD